MNIRAVDLSRQYEIHKKEILNAITQVLDNGDFILGADVRKIETSFSEYIFFCWNLDDRKEITISLSLGFLGHLKIWPNSFIKSLFMIIFKLKESN